MKVDLKAQYDAIRSEREAIQKRLQRLEELEQALRLLIAEIEASTKQQLALFADQSGNEYRKIGKTAKSRFILSALGDADDRSLVKLADMAIAKGVDFGGKSPKRSLHFTLIGLQRNGYAQMTDRNTWRLTTKALGQLGKGTKENNATVAGR